MKQQYISINGWQAKIRFSSAHVIPEYEKCGRLHGHTYAVHTKIYGKPDNKGIIIDFSLLKHILHEITEALDHKVLIPEKSTIIELTREKDQIIFSSLGKLYSFPVSDCRLLPLDSTSAENLSVYILTQLEKKLEHVSNVESIEIGVDEGFGQGAYVTKSIQ